MPRAYLRSSKIGLALALAESKPLPSRGVVSLFTQRGTVWIEL
jgi:hypothetical protein